VICQPLDSTVGSAGHVNENCCPVPANVPQARWPANATFASFGCAAVAVTGVLQDVRSADAASDKDAS
jgi:hypothetical protein